MKLDEYPRVGAGDEPDLAKLERERDVLEVQARYYRATNDVLSAVPLSMFPLSHEDIVTLHTRAGILRLPGMGR